MSIADDLLDLPLRDVVLRAGKAIVKHSIEGPLFDKRVDFFYDVVIYDEKFGRNHPIRVRVKFTAESLIFDTNNGEG